VDQPPPQLRPPLGAPREDGGLKAGSVHRSLEAGDSNVSNRSRGPLRGALQNLRRRDARQSTGARLQLTIVTTLVILVSTTGSGIILARALGPTMRGILTAAMLLGPLIANIGSLGIADALVYQSGRAKGRTSPVLASALVIGAAQTLVLIVVGWVAVPALLGSSTPSAVSPALVYLSVIPMTFLFSYSQAVLQGRLRLTEFNLVRLTSPVVYTAILVVLWRLGQLSISSALAASLASIAVYSVLAMAGAVGLSSSRPTFAVGRQLLAYGLRSHTGNLATILALQLDLLMLAAVVAPYEVGYYAVATSAAMAGGLIPGAVSMVLFPTFANQSPDALPLALARFLSWGLGGAFLLAPILTLLVPWAVEPVYGSAFRAAAPIALVLVPGYLIRGANQMLVAILRGSGRPMRASVGQIVGLGVLATLLPMGIVYRGPQGAAVAVTVSAAVAFIWLLATALKGSQVSARSAFLVWRSDLLHLRRADRQG